MLSYYMLLHVLPAGSVFRVVYDLCTRDHARARARVFCLVCSICVVIIFIIIIIMVCCWTECVHAVLQKGKNDDNDDDDADDFCFVLSLWPIVCIYISI